MPVRSQKNPRQGVDRLGDGGNSLGRGGAVEPMVAHFLGRPFGCGLAGLQFLGARDRRYKSGASFLGGEGSPRKMKRQFLGSEGSPLQI